MLREKSFLSGLHNITIIVIILEGRQKEKQQNIGMGKQKFLSGESSDYKQMTDLNKETQSTNK